MSCTAVAARRSPSTTGPQQSASGVPAGTPPHGHGTRTSPLGRPTPSRNREPCPTTAQPRRGGRIHHGSSTDRRPAHHGRAASPPPARRSSGSRCAGVRPPRPRRARRAVPGGPASRAPHRPAGVARDRARRGGPGRGTPGSTRWSHRGSRSGRGARATPPPRGRLPRAARGPPWTGAARRRRRAARQAAPTRRHPRGAGTAGRAPRAPPRRARARRRHRCGRGGPGSPRRRRRGPRAPGARATRARRGPAPRTAPAAGRYGPAADQAWASACSWWRGRSTSTRRAARCCSIAAPMSPAKSGCARVGRDLNSGCACVET